MGYEKVIINTVFYKNLKLITEAANLAGCKNIVVSIDIKNEMLGRKRCYVCDDTEKTGKDPIEMAKLAESLGSEEILINSITNDGAIKGYDIKLISYVAAGSLFVYYGSEKAVLINMPDEEEFIRNEIYSV